MVEVMARESKEVWCVVVDPKGAVKVQAVKFYLRRGTSAWSHNEWWGQASASKTEVLGEFKNEAAARAGLPSAVKRLAGGLREALERATADLRIAEAGERQARERFDAWAATAKAAGVDL